MIFPTFDSTPIIFNNIADLADPTSCKRDILTDEQKDYLCDFLIKNRSVTSIDVADNVSVLPINRCEIYNRHFGEETRFSNRLAGSVDLGIKPECLIVPTKELFKDFIATEIVKFQNVQHLDCLFIIECDETATIPNEFLDCVHVCYDFREDNFVQSVLYLNDKKESIQCIVRPTYSVYKFYTRAMLRTALCTISDNVVSPMVKRFNSGHVHNYATILRWIDAICHDEANKPCNEFPDMSGSVVITSLISESPSAILDVNPSFKGLIKESELDDAMRRAFKHNGLTFEFSDNIYTYALIYTFSKVKTVFTWVEAMKEIKPYLDLSDIDNKMHETENDEMSQLKLEATAMTKFIEWLENHCIGSMPYATVKRAERNTSFVPTALGIYRIQLPEITDEVKDVS